MPKRDRKTLSAYFKKGELPLQESFADLIESTVNILEDGFDKSPEDGLKLAQLKAGSGLISFFDEITIGKPLWSIRFSMPDYEEADSGYKNLNIFYGSNRSYGMTLSCMKNADSAQGDTAEAKINVGINQKAPQYELDVNGVVASNGRIGRADGKLFSAEKVEKEVLADGNWHPIIAGLNGCHAFEIMAGVGKMNSGKYALLHAFALNTFNSRKSNITSHQAHYMSKCDQIELRWTGDTHNYNLEIRTRCKYFETGDSEKIYIRYFITQLWFDPAMSNCTSSGNDAAKNENQ